MQDEDAREQILKLLARTTAIRNLLARMLANEARRSGAEPQALLRWYSELGDLKGAQAEEHNPELIEITEGVRAETDWILAEAQAILNRL